MTTAASTTLEPPVTETRTPEERWLSEVIRLAAERAGQAEHAEATEAELAEAARSYVRAGGTWTELGRQFGVSRQAVQARWSA